MAKRITTLTEEQHAAMAAHADKWIAAGWSTEPADFDRFAKAAEACYGYAGLPWHGNVVRVSSPWVLALAAPAAAYSLALRAKLASRGAVRGAVDDAVHGAVDDAVRGAVHGAVHGAVRGAGLAKAVGEALLRLWYYRLGGNLWANWNAFFSYFREHTDLELDGNLWERDKAYAETALSAGWWWPHRNFVMVSDRPAVLHVEQVGPRGWGSHRLHCADGPAIAWRDGYALYYWHGVRVTRELIEGKLSVEDILREPNAEVRRCAIEVMGWDQFVTAANLTQVSTSVPDPGNPGHVLELYELPEQIYDEPVRLLLCTNATDERDGTRRRFGLTVPASIDGPLAAAAWTFGLNPSVYAQLQHAC